MASNDLVARLKHIEGMIIGVKRRYGTKVWLWPQSVRDRYDGLCERARLIREQIKEEGDGDTVRRDYRAG